MYVNDVVNIGSAYEMTILELATTIIEKTNSKSSIVHLEALPEGDMSRRRPDISKMKSLLNSELISLSEGIDHLIKKQYWINA